MKSLALAQHSGVSRISVVADASAWRSLSTDPQLLLVGEIPWPDRDAFLFEVDVLPINGCRGIPTLYFDFGVGFEERNSVHLGKTALSPKPWSAVVRLGMRPRRIRLDPCEAVGDFLCSEVRVRTLPESRQALAGHEPQCLPRGRDTAAHGPADRARAEVPARALEGELRLGVVAHLYYEDLWPEMAAYLGNVLFLERLYVSIPEGASAGLEDRIQADFPGALVKRFPNRGRDVLPFLAWLEVAAEHGVDVLCKIHSKRSPHVALGQAWRHDILGKLLGSEAIIRNIVSTFVNDPSVGIVGPAGHVISSRYFWERNAARVRDLGRRMGEEVEGTQFDYVAGSMFWARVDALLPLRRLGLREDDFEAEAGEVDGTLAHALERCFPLAARAAGFRLTESAREDASTKTVFDFAPLPPGVRAPAIAPAIPPAIPPAIAPDIPGAPSRGNLGLEPWGGVEATQRRQGEWRSTGDDPRFRLLHLEDHRGKWVRLRIEISVDESLRLEPYLYLDTGGGFSQESAMRLPPPEPSSGTISFVFRVPENLEHARFDPLEFPALFQIDFVDATDLEPVQAVDAMVGDIAKFAPDAELVHTWRNAVVEGRLIAADEPGLLHLHAEYSELTFWSGSYLRWIELNEPPRESFAELARQESEWRETPLISVIMPTYNTPEALLRAAMESVIGQVYPRWELCIADDASTQPHVRRVLEEYAARDARIRICYREVNGHISAASNSALALCTGEFTAFLDHDDALHPLALHFVAEAINRHPGCELLFSDEDKLDVNGARRDPYFKCDLNPELLLAHNMVCHLAVYRTQTLRQVGGLREGYEGAQDYDLVLRVIDRVGAANVIHIPRVLYHWRIGEGSTAMSSDEKPYAILAARKAIGDHLARQGTPGRVVDAPDAPGMNRVIFDLPAALPKVTIVIPTRDRVDLLRMCVDSVLAKTTYPKFDLLVIDNGSVEARTREFLAGLPRDKCRVVRDESHFNFAALNNLGARCADGEFLCLLNNDIEVLTPGWLEEMMRFGIREDVGAVGARLWYPDRGLQHGGAILGIGGVAGHSHKGLPQGMPGYFGRAVLHQRMSAVTAACMLVRRSTYLAVGGLDEKLQVAFNDIDFCLRLRDEGYHNVWTPYAELVHHESASRGYETTPEKKVRFEREVNLMKARWRDALQRDPAYSVNLTLKHEDFTLRW